MRKSQGFTLIELVAVIVILGILAAVAVPKFFNLSSEAKEAALQGTVGAIESASTLNYAAYEVSKNPASGPVPIVTAGKSCLAVAKSLLSGQQNLTTNYTITGTIPATANQDGTVYTCSISYNGTAYSSNVGIIISGS